MTGRNAVMVWAVWLIVSAASFAPAGAAENGKAFTVADDEFGPVYRVEIDKVKSAADLMEVPGVKVAWDIRDSHPHSWMANARDVDGDGRIDLFVAGTRNDNCCIVRYTQDGRLVWNSEPIDDNLGHESGMAIEDMDGDGSYEIAFHVNGQVWCLDADTGKAEWKNDLPKCRDNHQASVVGHFLDRKRFAIICRVYRDVACFDSDGSLAWKYRIDQNNDYGHDMAHYDADGDGLDEAYISLNGKFLALGGDGKLRWADTSCRHHSDFILCGDVDEDGKREIVYDRCGCDAKRGPIVCMDGRTGKLVRQWTYPRPGKDHLQKATLGDFDPSQPGLELAAVGKRRGAGGLILWSSASQFEWRKDLPTSWVTWGDWTGSGNPEILLSTNVGWEVWTGKGNRLYAITGIGQMPMGVESAGQKRPDLDGNGKADVLLSPNRYIVLMEAP